MSSIDYWIRKVSEDWFDAPIKEILDERQPASIGKVYLTDVLEERHPELFERYKPKVISQCIDWTLKANGYTTISKRRKTYWRLDLI